MHKLNYVHFDSSKPFCRKIRKSDNFSHVPFFRISAVVHWRKIIRSVIPVTSSRILPLFASVSALKHREWICFVKRRKQIAMKTKEKRKRKSIEKENLNSAMKLLRRRAFSFLKCFHKEQLEREGQREIFWWWWSETLLWVLERRWSEIGAEAWIWKVEAAPFWDQSSPGSKAPEKFTNGFSFGNGTSLNPNFLLLNLCPPWKFFVPWTPVNFEWRRFRAFLFPLWKLYII